MTTAEQPRSDAKALLAKLGVDRAVLIAFGCILLLLHVPRSVPKDLNNLKEHPSNSVQVLSVRNLLFFLLFQLELTQVYKSSQLIEWQRYR